MSIAKHNDEIYSKMFTKKNKFYHDFHKSKNKIFMSLINDNPKTVLDLGCGDGWLGMHIKKKFNSEVHGIDISKQALKRTKKYGLITINLNLEGKKWPYKSNTFDLVIAVDIIEHLYDTETFVKEAFRVLKKGGIFLVSVPNINVYYNRLLILFGKMPLWIECASNLSYVPIIGNIWINTGHIRVFNKDSICKLLMHYGFEIVKVKGAPFNLYSSIIPDKLRKFVSIAQRFENFFGRFPRTSSMIVVKAMKK